MFVQSFYFVSYYFLELNMMIFLKKFQETYNSRLRERYGDDPSTHSDFDPDLWMEVGSSGRPEKNQVYGLFNTTAENLRPTRSVSTVGSSPSVSSTQSEEFMAMKQQYQQLSTNYDQLRQMVMEMRSRMGDDTCAAPLQPFSPGNNQPPPPSPPPPLFYFNFVL
jgi:3-deoxy-D-manno-octulosonic-acid transferase